MVSRRAKQSLISSYRCVFSVVRFGPKAAVTTSVGYLNCDITSMTERGVMQPFTLLPPVLNQSFSNGSNADKAPFLNMSTAQPATRLLSSLCAIDHR
jgi:hypothetical protein